MTAVDFFELLGSRTMFVLWLPLLAWTVFWMVLEGVLHLKRDLHPAARYRAYQAVLLCLPVGLLVAAVVDLTSVMPEAPALITFDAPIAVSAAPPTADVQPGMEAHQTLSLPLVLGAVVLLAAIAAVLQLARLAINAFALSRFGRSITSEANSDGTAPRRSVIREGLRSIVVVETHDAAVPMTFGLLRPIVVIPSSLGERQRRLALAHELVHIRQGDYLAQWLESVVAAVFAIHPAVHILRRRCDLMREMTCDAALAGDPAFDRRSYADLLIRFVAPQPVAQAASVSMADSQPHIHKRLNAMKRYSSTGHSNPNRSAWALALCIMIFGAGALVVPQVFAQQGEAPPPPPAAIAGPEAPLIVVDGVPFDGILDDIRPDRIGRIDVLRGEEAVDAYGDRGRNGVVLITTGEGPPAPPLPPAPLHPQSDTSTFVIVESMPEIIGGLRSIQQDIRYPATAREEGIEGRVFVQFVVDEEGRVVDAEVTRGLGGGLDEEALRVVRNARFKPGMQRGEPVRVQMALPIMFRLGDDTGTAQATAAGRDLASVMSMEVRPDDGSVTIHGTAVHPSTQQPLIGASITATMGDRTAGSAADNEGRFVLHLDDVMRPTGTPIDLRISHPSLEAPLAVELNGAAREAAGELPAQFSVTGAFPNPTDGTATLTFDLPENGQVGVELFDMQGRRVLSIPDRAFNVGAGHAIHIDASSLAAGTYMYRVTADLADGAQTGTGNLTLVR